MPTATTKAKSANAGRLTCAPIALLPPKPRCHRRTAAIARRAYDRLERLSNRVQRLLAVHANGPRTRFTAILKRVGSELGPQLTAFFTSASILASSAVVNLVSAKATGHIAPSSRCATSLNPNVAYLDLNFCAL